MTKTCIIIDDENMARALLRNVLQDVAPNVTILAECDDLPNGIKAIKKHNPDIVFLDIEMPGHSGLSILDFFNEEEVNFDIVFTTGYSEYAIQAFKLSAADYLLKPINPDMLQQTVERIFKAEEKNRLVNYKTLQDNLKGSTDANDKCIVVNLTGVTRFIKVKDIAMLEADGSYCRLYLKNDEKITSSKNLKYFEETLSGLPNFFRSHKSNIVNLKYVTEFNRAEGEIFLEHSLKAMLSTDKIDLLIEKMKQLV
ncbi:MAG TPA: LytTR family DNA-binding domain-containing protein [Chitinophagaceae bacterium]|nr:LytTR family DNA-binding domain-containing protein [Ferruginibacter sp.]HUM98142.1 LytTR family DNA-binding domain-containing protein [Chitinophagaceae bacterium]